MAKQNAGTTKEVDALVMSLTFPWTIGMIAPPPIAMASPAAPNLVASPSPAPPTP